VIEKFFNRVIKNYHPMTFKRVSLCVAEPIVMYRFIFFASYFLFYIVLHNISIISLTYMYPVLTQLYHSSIPPLHQSKFVIGPFSIL